MINIYVNRIYKSLQQDIKLIHYYKIYSLFHFFVLGTSEYIYNVTINKNNINCNCDDFNNGNMCKHIHFILFKLLKLFKIIKNDSIKLIYNNSMINTNYFNNLFFEELEWEEFIRKYNNIKYYLRTNNFCHNYNKKFKIIHNNYKYYFNNYVDNSNDNCKICLQKDNTMVKCPRCKNIFHISCILIWFEDFNKDNCCPICKEKEWNTIVKYIIFYSNYKFPLKYLKI